ncbi:hypothetical protein LNN31_08195 [Acetobacterium wieringae]|uniref:Uncharacterized protein n=1 Tax=Acetobacterium wieringae TaxID=52694 RepID=A0ABY6HKI1_9FIRM|nr:hypothetical protein [Acetobacterium wieringae]UYO64389.1 hypothetical protein LNN31_08195 [Acetobacterium wieringae]
MMEPESIHNNVIISIIVLFLCFYAVFFIKNWYSKSEKIVGQKIRIIYWTFAATLVIIFIAEYSDMLVLGLEEYQLSEKTSNVALFYLSVLYSKMPIWSLQLIVIFGAIFVIVEFIMLFIKINDIKKFAKLMIFRKLIFFLLALGCLNDTILVYQAMMMFFFAISCLDRS